MNGKSLVLGSLAAGGAIAMKCAALSKSRPAGIAENGSSFDAIDAHLERERRRLNVPGISLAIVEGERIVHLRGFGRSRRGGDAPTPQTPFMIASLTKSFTALAVMQLVEAGKIELDVPVQRYLPWFRVADFQASARITVRHLLNQTSGLPTWTGETSLADFDSGPGATEYQCRERYQLSRLARAPGGSFEYCNSNYNLLGLVIEAASGENYADYVQEHILTPLDMRRTYTSQAVARQNGLAVGHQYWFAIPFAAPNLPFPHGSLPGGGLISCAEDIAHYLVVLLNGGCYGNVRILSSAGIDELQRGVADISMMGRSLGQYGMGWFVSKVGQTKIAWHSGTLPDFFAYMAVMPEQKRGMVLLLNVDHHWMNPVLTDFATGVAARVAGVQPDPFPFLGLVPWALRGLLLVPALQIADVAGTLCRLSCWRQNPQRRPSGGHFWFEHVLLPLIPSLLPALTLRPMLGKRRDYLKLYMPDFSLIALVSGSLALVWSVLRSLLVLRATKPDPDSTS